MFADDGLFMTPQCLHKLLTLSARKRKGGKTWGGGGGDKNSVYLAQAYGVLTAMDGESNRVGKYYWHQTLVPLFNSSSIFNYRLLGHRRRHRSISRPFIFHYEFIPLKNFVMKSKLLLK